MNCGSGLTALALIMCVTAIAFAQDQVRPGNLEPAAPQATDDRDYYEPARQAPGLQDDRQVEGPKPFGRWPRKTISEIQLDVRDQSEVVPEDRLSELTEKKSDEVWRSFQPQPRLFAWAAPDIRYQPLYFEDVALERYGQTAGWYKQPVCSALHASKSFVTLLNQMRHDRPASCDYPLGFCRPGDCLPAIYQRQYFGICTDK